MADPLSVGAGVAGLMSLAVTACQSIATYYASWKGYEKDIHTMCQYMEIVSNNMRRLQMCLDGHQFPADLRQQVETAIVACSDQINALDRELELVKLTIPPESSQEKLKLYIRRAKYPFKESTLKKIRESLVSIQAAVDSSVNILGIDSLGSLNSTAMTTVTELGDAKQNIKNISRDVPSILTVVNRIDQDLPNVCNEMALVRSNAHGIKEDVQILKNHLQKSEERLDVLPLIKDRIDTLPASLASSVMVQLESRDLERRQLLLGGPGNSEISEKIGALAQEIKRLQLHVISKPSLLREELDNASEDGFFAMNRRPKQSGLTISPLRPMRKCSCRARVDSPRTRWISENFQIFTSVTKTHRTSCPFSGNYGQVGTQTVGVRTILARPFFAKALEFSLGVTYGAGGCSLATSIKLQTFLRKDSPAFQLFEYSDQSWSMKFKHTDEQLSGYITKALQMLKVLFSERKASPYDIDSKGRTILQLAIHWKLFSRSREMGARSQSARKTLLLDLVQMGVPLDHKDFDDKDVLSELILTERGTNIIDPGLHVWPSLIKLSPLTRLPGLVSPAVVFQVARDLEEYADLYDCGILSTSILSRDQELVEEILQKRPYLVNERNSLGQSPLHLAADWLWGTNRLLEAGASVDTKDNSYFRPLSYAAMMECWVVFEKLLVSGSPILTLSYPPCTFQFDLGVVFNLIGNSLPPQTFDHFCIVLADRRKRLMELAKQILNFTDYSNLVSSNLGLLDSKAGEVCKKILDGGYKIPPALQIPSHAFTVYHTFCLNLAEMSKLYNVGFREVDTRNNLGDTPLMIAMISMQNIEDVSRCEWLISKGADPLGKLGQFGAAHTHYLAVELAHWAVQILEVLHRKNQALSDVAFMSLEPGLRLISRHYGTTIRDHCQCGCSANGCSPLHLLLNNTLNYVLRNISMKHRGCFYCNGIVIDHPDREIILAECAGAYRRSLYYFFTWVLEFFHEDKAIPHSAYLEVIQLCLFLELGLTHTCLTLRSHDKESHLMPEEEIHEIQEEEREMLLELETLCEEGSARIVLYEGLFCEFLEEFMSEVRSRPRARLTTEDIYKIGAIGVMLEQE